MTTTADTLQLRVVNTERMHAGTVPRHTFDAAGGTIGSGDTTWRIADGTGGIEPCHAEVRQIDGAFCLIDRSGRTRINGCDRPLGKSCAVRLCKGDRIHLGALTLAVHVYCSDASLAESSVEEQSVETLLQPGTTWWDTLPPTDVPVALPGMSRTSVTDVLAWLPAMDDATLDPLQALGYPALAPVSSLAAWFMPEEDIDTTLRDADRPSPSGRAGGDR